MKLTMPTLPSLPTIQLPAFLRKLRKTRVAPAVCRCTATQRSVRFTTPPAIFLPSPQHHTAEEPQPSEPRSDSSESQDGPFSPKYTSTGISNDDLEFSTRIMTTNTTPLIIPAELPEEQDPMITTPNINYSFDLPAPVKPARATAVHPVVLDLQHAAVFDAPPPPTSTPSGDTANRNSATRSLRKMAKRNFSRGRTFIRKMRTPRTLPAAPSTIQQPSQRSAEMTKRSLPSMPRSFLI